MFTNNDFIAFKQGNEQAFKAIFDCYYKGLFFFAKKYLADDSEVEDLLQEVFRMLWEKKATLKDALALKTFLYVSTRNRALNIIRHNKIVTEHQNEFIAKVGDLSYFKNQLIEEETYRLLINAINELPAQSQKVCKMLMNGARNVEIAEVLGITTSTVKYHKQQAFSILREKLGEQILILPVLVALFESCQ